jgi:hypothetical protein
LRTRNFNPGLRFHAVTGGMLNYSVCRYARNSPH